MKNRLAGDPGDLDPDPDVCPDDGHTEDPLTIGVGWESSPEKPSWGSEICH